jgi:hypothetical protein
MGFDAGSARGATAVGPGTGVRVLVWGGFPLVGAGVGRLLAWIADWVARLPWVPLKGPFTLLAAVSGHLAVMIGAPVVGGIAGLVVAVLAERDFVTVAVGANEVTVARGGTSHVVPRTAVHAVFLDRKQLVLLGERTRELIRQHGDLPDTARIEAAFRGAGYPWSPDGDPYQAEYRRWVEGLPELPTAADALLRARARALERRDADDAAQLRGELGNIDVVVRDEGTRQYVRRIPSPGGGPRER